ncbi:hypothetical protein Tco_0653987 [Tanacetum coccineum]|uniref:Uncharacterized protein n=1 Tax=Tanacetum coccineum TaxID=301880 RepID=A0ABQ4X1Y7_9ASTR
MESSNSNSKEKELQHMQLKDMKLHQKSIEIFQELKSHLKTLYPINSFRVTHNRLFEISFCKFFSEEHQNFRKKMFHNLDQLQLQFERDHFHEVNAKTCLKVLQTNLKNFFASNRHLDILAKCIDKRVLKYDELRMKEGEVKAIKETKQPLNEAIPHEHEIEKSFKLQSTDVQINLVQAVDANLVVTESKALDDGSVVTKSSGTKSNKQDTSNNSWNYITHVMDADIRPVNDQVPFYGEKVIANVAFKNELKKLKGNSVDTKFAKPSILGKPVLQPPKKQSVVRQPNTFKSERPNFSKQRFASQVDMNNIFSKSVTPYYLPKVRESEFVKPHHVIASGSSRNSSKELYGSNDMANNYYLEEAKKKTQDENMNLKPSVMHTTSLQNTTNGSKPKPKSNNQTSRSLRVSKSSCGMSNGVPLVDHSRNSSSFSNSKHFVCSTCQKCVFNANHDACITKFLKEVNSHVKVQSPKTRYSNKLVEPKIHTQKPGRQIDPTGKTFTSSTTKVNCKRPNGSNEDITNPYECDQTLNVSAGTLNLSAVPLDLSKDTKPYIKLRSSRFVHWDQQKQSPNSSQGVKEQQKCTHFDDPCHELLLRVYIS